MKRKIPVLLLCLLLCVPLLVMSAFADEDEWPEATTAEELIEALNNGGASIDVVADIVLNESVTVPEGMVLVIRDEYSLSLTGEGTQLTIEEGALVIIGWEAALGTENGAHIVNRGTLQIGGKLNTCVCGIADGEAECSFVNEGNVFGGSFINSCVRLCLDNIDEIDPEHCGCIGELCGSVDAPIRFVYETPDDATDAQIEKCRNILSAVLDSGLFRQIEIASDLATPVDSELRFSFGTDVYLAPGVTVANNGVLNFLDAHVYLDSYEEEDSASIVNNGFVCFNSSGEVDKRITVSGGTVSRGTGVYEDPADLESRINATLWLDDLTGFETGDRIATLYVLADVGNDDSFEGFAFTDHDEEGNLCGFTDRLNDSMWLEPYEGGDVPEGYIAYELKINLDLMREYTVTTISPLRWTDVPGGDREEWFNVLLSVYPETFQKLFWFDFGDIMSIDDDGRINTWRYEWECAASARYIGLGETLGNGCLAGFTVNLNGPGFYVIPSDDLFVHEEGGEDEEPGERFVSIERYDDGYGLDIHAEKCSEGNVVHVVGTFNDLFTSYFDAIIGEPSVGIYTAEGMDLADLMPGDIDLSGLESDPVYYIYTPDTWIAPKNELSVSFGEWRQDENGDDWHHYPYSIPGVTIEPYDDGDIFDGEDPIAYCWKMTVSRDIDTFREGDITLYRCADLAEYDYNEEWGTSRWIRINPSFDKILVWFWGMDAGIEFDGEDPYLVSNDPNRDLTEMFETHIDVPVGCGRWGCLARIEIVGDDVVFVPVHVSELEWPEALDVSAANVDGHGPEDEYPEKGYYVEIRANDVPDEELRVSDGERGMVIGAYRAPMITVQDKEVLPGQDVDINIMMENDGFGEVAAMILQVRMDWDDEVGQVDYCGADNGDLFDDFDEGSASTVLTQLLLSSDFNVTWSGRVATLHFHVPDDEAFRGRHFSIWVDIPENDGAVNENGDRVEVNCNGGGITVMFFLWGDADGNGSVTLRDLVLLRRGLAEIIDKNDLADGADANADGNVDTLDLTLLRRYLANYDYDLGSSSVVLGPNA